MDTNILNNKYLSVMIVKCNKKHLSNIWGWNQGKVKQLWDWVKKSVAFIKKHEYFQW